MNTANEILKTKGFTTKDDCNFFLTVTSKDDRGVGESIKARIFGEAGRKQIRVVRMITYIDHRGDITCKNPVLYDGADHTPEYVATHIEHLIR